ncbi:hypothetical protein Tsubulata_013671 [Turnera subulata]|uniref:Heparan-alpha-glucosaminide N-acetyltransferase catalytic domain-containing protein n=1 Tax=Turnera subulata TaxID=218843 RepID=A0A9Q0FQ55_9ROSI|nr:hypothetical protein Tsubulata_013671 [Turnera subulata]
MAENEEPLLPPSEEQPQTIRKSPRVASLDVFRGLCVFLMMLVDYGGSIFPVIAHSPWNGLHLADFVMPFFLFIAGVSLALVYKRVSNRVEATWKAALRAVKLFFLGVLLQGGYFHGINSLTYGVDIERIRWLGILQCPPNLYFSFYLNKHSRNLHKLWLLNLFLLSFKRISIGYLIAALCEIWLTYGTQREVIVVKKYYWHWGLALLLSAIYMGLLHGLYVPDWQFSKTYPTSSLVSTNDTLMYTVKCSVRGDLGPACNSAGMIDRYVLGPDHLYQKPVYRNLKECNMSASGQIPEGSPSWCLAPFDPEGILSSITAAATCVIGLQYGHILGRLQDHKGRMENWSLLSVSLLVLGAFLALIGIPVNKSLYTLSYMLITSASSGLTYCALYLLVDVYGYRRLTYFLEWMGLHSLSIFVLVSSNLVVIAIQGFYWAAPQNNIIHWIVSCFVHQ